MNPYAQHGSSAKAEEEKIGNMENVKAWFHTRGVKAEQQAEAEAA